MIDLGLMKHFLGIKFKHFSQGVFIWQQKHATYILKKFIMDKCKLVETSIAIRKRIEQVGWWTNSGLKIVWDTYRQPHVPYATKLDVIYEIILLSRFMESLRDEYGKVGKIMLRYISST